MTLKYFKFLYKQTTKTAYLPNCLLLDINYNFFTMFYISNMHFLNIKYFFYSLIIFFSWILFITEKNMNLLLILDIVDKYLIQYLLINKKYDYIYENIWIPGLLSNTKLVTEGKRFSLASKVGNTIMSKKTEMAFFCSTKKSIILQEMDKYLIPTLVTFDILNLSTFLYFIPLYPAKWKYIFEKLKN